MRDNRPYLPLEIQTVKHPYNEVDRDGGFYFIINVISYFRDVYNT